MKPTKLLILFLFLSLKGFSQTTITSNITITQTWVDDPSNTRPWTISGNVTVTFSQDLVLNNVNQYFEIIGTNVTIDGANKTVTLDGIINYPGVVDASGDAEISVSNALIKNIGVVNLNNSTLAVGGGYISGRENQATITNCYSTGPISAVESGGIAGRFNGGNISNCYSTGAISGVKSGGITVYSMNKPISNCFSTGAISGSSSGGIVGMQNYSDIENCYSSGIISGTFFVDTYNTWAVAGGIAPSTPSNTITNSYIGNGTWNSINANAALITGLGSVWNTSVSPYALLSFVPAAPTFANSGPITLCLNGSYYLNPSTTSGTFSSLDPTIATVNSSGYVTAGAITGTTIVSLVISGGGTVTATVTVGSSSGLSITDPLAQPSYKFNNNPQGPIGGINNYVGYNGYYYSSQARPISAGFFRASNQSGNEAGCPYEFNIFRCTTCGKVTEDATRPQGTFSGNTILLGSTGQLTYTSTNGGGPFTIVYLPSGGSNVTVNNISSTVAFNVATPTITTSYKLISVTDEITKASTDFSGTSATVNVSALSVGESYGGGIVFYILVPGDPGYDANTQHGLIAATSDQSTGIIWYNGFYPNTGATGTAIGTGLANTNKIIEIQGITSEFPVAATSYAAGLARDYTGGGYTDWYLPSKDELNKLYLNRVAVGGFAGDMYWSSSSAVKDGDGAWFSDVRIGFNGIQWEDYEVNTYYVRAIRSF